MNEDQSYNRRSYSINEREIGALISQVDYLKEVVKTVQDNINDALTNRKDIEYALKDISKSFDTINKHLIEMDEKINKISSIMNDHITKDIGFDTILQTKLGKWFLGIIALILSTFAIDIVHRLKDILWQ